MTEASATLVDNVVQQIPRRSALSYEEFVHDYLYPHQPVIIEDAVGWSAFTKWSPDFFKAQFGARRVNVRGQQMTVSEFVDRVLNATEENPSPYLTGVGPDNYCLDIFPELAADIDPVPKYLLPNWLGDR